MYSESGNLMNPGPFIRNLLVALSVLSAVSCSIQGKIRNLIGRGVTADIAIPSSVPEDDEP
ncbi:MAG: hypothetical protein ACI39U_02665, partial [Candidatus Cryptobacteroides sp.]